MVTELRWQKSSYSGGAEGNACVELFAIPTTQLTTTPIPLAQLLDAIHAGTFTSRP
ncbi:DUF397 domain-containing protein [Streptomyces xylophagus]|uniref:DUF397 domain-containing protein n=1 Tax=Streptomyces xylophagus TaxID=285514 RepID=UPI000997E313|nr:DUF397 domain-containing protein [Streptomyces xylophagus]